MGNIALTIAATHAESGSHAATVVVKAAAVPTVSHAMPAIHARLIAIPDHQLKRVTVHRCALLRVIVPLTGVSVMKTVTIAKPLLDSLLDALDEAIRQEWESLKYQDDSAQFEKHLRKLERKVANARKASGV